MSPTTYKSWEVVYVIKKVKQLFSKHRVSKIVSSVWWCAVQTKKCCVMCGNVIDACTTSNDVWVKSKFVQNVMLESKIDLHIVAIPPPQDRDRRENDIRSNPLGTNSTVFASSPWALSHVSVTHKKRSTPLSFINVDISQRLQAISLHFNYCAINGCTFCFLHFTPRLERWRRGI